MRQKEITTDEIGELVIAGAFGLHLNKDIARAIGMLPEVPLGMIKEIGNAAGAGAKLALISQQKRREAERISETTNYYELALDIDFAEEYANAMLFPPA